jgi:hypothetical protein
LRTKLLGFRSRVSASMPGRCGTVVTLT